jgi:class 3 adenylate cyclase
MASLPTGTVTFLFTDIERSTRLQRELGDRYGELVSLHRRLLRDAVAENQGVEIDSQGDAFFFSFARARDAAAAAVTGQLRVAAEQWPDGVRPSVRMGLHTGEPTLGEEGYVGLDVVRGARVAAAAHGGQIMLSEATRALLPSDLGNGLRVVDLGEHRLKDMDEPERLYQLEAPGLETSFPAARSEQAPRAEDVFKEKIDAYVRRQLDASLRSLDHAETEQRGRDWRGLLGRGDD